MRFVIIGSQRTGSTHLVATLSGHPEIFCNSNVFKRSKIQVFWPKSHWNAATKQELMALRETDPFAFLERIYSANFDRAHVGFKIFEGQNDRILDHLIQDPSVRKIVLYRRNVLANYSSSLAAAGSGKYASGVGTLSEKVKFKEDTFREFHDDYVRFYREVIHKLNANREVFYLVNYEDLNNPSLRGALVNFIGADPFADISEEEQYRVLVKQNPNDILARFSNPDVVEAFLTKYGLLHWAQEGESSLTSLSVARPEPAGQGAVSHAS